MSQDLDQSGCTTIGTDVYCQNNITQIFYDGIIRNSTDCTVETCSLVLANWGYLPTIPGNVFFIILFALVFFFQVPLGLWRRTWGVLIGMVIGSAFEVVGYAGRVLAHNKPFDQMPFLIYIIFLTIGPAFLCAAIYLCLARIMVVYGESNARLRPRTYSIIFMFSDFVALVLQGAGGGVASSAAGNNESQAKMGINIMIAGIAWQLISLTIFALAAADFAWCVKRGREEAPQSFMSLRISKKFKAFLWALALQTLAIYIRSAYRVAELSDGYNGTIANEEAPYMIFEPTMIFIACAGMTILHPSFVFGATWKEIDTIINGKKQAIRNGEELSAVSNATSLSPMNHESKVIYHASASEL